MSSVIKSRVVLTKFISEIAWLLFNFEV
jgi:hypothetical protein